MASDWTTTTIDDAVELIIDHRGRTPKKLGSDFVSSGVQVVSAKNVYSGCLHLDENQRFVDSDTAKRWMPQELHRGDVIITSEAPLGETAFVNGATGVCLGQRLFALRPRSGKTDGRFLYCALQSPVLQNRLNARATGTTAQGIRQSELRKVEIELPALSEQKRIASVLGAIDDKIDSNRRLAKLLEETAATLFKARFVDFVGAEEFEESEIGRVPRGWRMGCVRDLARMRYGRALKEADRVGGEVAVVGSSGVVGMHNMSLFKGPLVVVGRKGTAGRVTWVGRDAWPIDTTFAADPTEGWPVVYIYFALRAVRLSQLVADSAVPGLNREAAEERAVVLPPASEAHSFASFAEPLFAQMDAMRDEAVTLETIRDTLLPKLISGEIRVPDTSDPEEVIGPAAAAFASAAS